MTIEFTPTSAPVPGSVADTSSSVVARPSDRPSTDGGGHPERPGRGSNGHGGPRRTVRRAAVPLVALSLGALGAAGVISLTGDGDEAGAEPTLETTQVRTAEAEVRDLVEYEELDGTMTFADNPLASATTPGTVTAVADEGDLLERGSTGYEVDARPVTAWYGTIPLYRPMAEGDEGEDVLVVEQNLASLGYHATSDEDGADGTTEVDTGFTVDGVFDAATTDAVERWQADLGLEETGTVSPGDVLIVAGPSLVSSVEADTGAVVQNGTPVLGLSVTAEVSSFHAADGGEIEMELTSGPVGNGDVLYVVDDLPVTAVLVDPGTEVGDDIGGNTGLAAGLERTLRDGVDDGADVEALEAMLAALGHDADGELTIDREFDDATSEAVTEWQESLEDTWDDVLVDGEVAADDIVFVPADASVETVTEREGDGTGGGAELFTWRSSGADRIVTTAIPASNPDALVEGQEVEVRFPDGETAAGTVTSVASSSVRDQADPDGDAELAVEIALSELPSSAEGFNRLDVDVLRVQDLADGVVVVPVSALVVTDNGYAVEVATRDSDATRFVAVEPGMFADGLVEVTGIDPGTEVVIP